MGYYNFLRLAGYALALAGVAVFDDNTIAGLGLILAGWMMALNKQ